jgi:hypothetical protein
MAEGQEIFHQEIAELEAKLAAKKQELMRSGVESPEKAVFKQVVREHVTAGEQPKVVIPTTAAPAKAAPVRKTTPEEERQVNLLIAHAFTKGLAAAISEARKTNDAYFIDLLHDRLADEYYQKLLATRKVKPI